jgi:hypothetical protein
MQHCKLLFSGSRWLTKIPIKKVSSFSTDFFSVIFVACDLQDEN